MYAVKIRIKIKAEWVVFKIVTSRRQWGDHVLAPSVRQRQLFGEQLGWGDFAETLVAVSLPGTSDVHQFLYYLVLAIFVGWQT